MSDSTAWIASDRTNQSNRFEERSCFMDDTYVVFTFKIFKLLLFRLDLLRKCGDHLFNLSNVLDWVSG